MQRWPLLLSGAVVLILISISVFISSEKTSNVDQLQYTDKEPRELYDSLFQLYWRLTDQAGNVSIEATLFTPDLRQALLDIEDPSDHQVAMKRELSKLSEDEVQIYVLIAQPSPVLSDPDLTDSILTVDGEEIELKWNALDPLWLDQSGYFQRDGFLSGTIDLDASSIMLNINYPDNTIHKFNW